MYGDESSDRTGDLLLIIVAAIAVTATGCPAPYELPAENQLADVEAPGPCGDDVEQRVVQYVNHARDADGLRMLECDEQLGELARSHSQDMCENDYVDHDDSQGRTFAQRFEQAQIDANTFAENVAGGQRTAREVHERWMNSRGHRQNIVNERFTRIGVGYVSCGGEPRWTQVFAGP